MFKAFSKTCFIYSCKASTLSARIQQPAGMKFTLRISSGFELSSRRYHSEIFLKILIFVICFLSVPLQIIHSSKSL